MEPLVKKKTDLNQESDKQILLDAHGRYYKKLRVSVLDACNYRCRYCMPDLTERKTNPTLSFNRNLLTPEEIFKIVRNLVHFGTREVRITGGEPCLRKDLVEIVQLLSTLKLDKLALTTNASKLKKILEPLKQTSLSNMNISLDSLDRQRFQAITGRDELDLVVTNILLAQKMGFDIKVNCVVMKGINDDELFDFIDFSYQHNLPIRFLEVMKIGVVNHHKSELVTAQEILSKIKTKYQVKRLIDPIDSTSMNYELHRASSRPVKIGFIASESVPFCTGCSRLRLAADGKLKACLFKEVGIDIRHLERSRYPEVLEMIKKMKPTSRIKSTSENMYRIGG